MTINTKIKVMPKLSILANPLAAIGSAVGVTAAPRRATADINFAPAKARTAMAAQRGAHAALLQPHMVQYAVYAFIALNVALLVGYIISINTSAAAGYEITKLQRNVHELTEQNKKLTLENAAVNSMASINDTLNQEGFVPVAGAEYVQTTPQHLTQR